MTERRYWGLCLWIPIVIPLLPIVVLKLAGPPDWLNAMSAENPLKATLGLLMGSLLVGVPLYLPMALSALVALEKWGTGWVIRWLAAGPIVYTVLFVAIINGVFGAPIAPGAIAVVMGTAYVYVAIAYIGYRTIFGS